MEVYAPFVTFFIDKIEKVEDLTGLDQLQIFTRQYGNTICSIQTNIKDPATKLQLFFHSAQCKLPFRLFASSSMLQADINTRGISTTFITQLQNIHSKFFSNLRNSYPIVGLPTAGGGIRAATPVAKLMLFL